MIAQASFQVAARRAFDVAMVWFLSQLRQATRLVIDVANALHRHGVDLYSRQGAIDTTTSLGKSAYVSFAALARHEHEQFRERFRIGLARARRNGVRLGRPMNLNDSVRAAIPCSLWTRRLDSPDRPPTAGRERDDL